MNYLFKKWDEKLAESKLEGCTLNNDLGILSRGFGYISNNPVLFNATTNTVVFNSEKIKRDGGLINVILNCHRKICKDTFKTHLNECFKEGVFDNKRYSQVRGKLISFPQLKEQGFDLSMPESEQKGFILKAHSKVISDGKSPSNIASSTMDGSWIDWSGTFNGMKEENILKLILYATRTTFPTIPSDARRADSMSYSTATEILESPAGYVLSKLTVHKFVQESYSTIFTDSIDKTLESYIKVFSDNNVTRAPIGAVFGTIYKALAELTLMLASQEYLYLPYLFGFRSTHKLTSDRFMKDNNLHQALIRIEEKEVRLMFRGLLLSTNIKEIADLPYELPPKVSSSYREFYTSKGYLTGGFPHHEWKSFLTHVETSEWLEKNENKRFDRSYLNKTSQNKIKMHGEQRQSAQYAQLQGLAGDSLRQTLVNYSIDKSGSTVTCLNKFADWIVSESSNIYLESMSEIKHKMIFSNGEVEIPTSKTFYEYIDKLPLTVGKNRREEVGTEISITTKRDNWAVVKAFSYWWSKKESLNTGEDILDPFSIANTPFGSNKRRAITSRESMPSLLHELCVEVLTEDNFKIYRNDLDSTQSRLYNFSTRKWDTDTWNTTVPRCLHLLLLLPVRGMQARWLDEGLLDDMIWDFDKASYVKNEHPLANFKYPKLKTHKKLFARTAVISSEDSNGYEGLNLYINTNKTASRKALIEGGQLGYKLPWPYNSGVSTIDDVWNILKEQKAFNNMYSPPVVTPCNQRDENNEIFQSLGVQLPYYTPLFRRYEESVSKSSPETRRGLLLPITQSSLSVLFKKVLKEAEIRYKAKFPQFKNSLIAFDADGKPRHDIHSLRVYGITDLLDKGIPLDVVQMIVGHATSIMTLYYRKKDRLKFLKTIKKVKKDGGAALLHEKELLESGDFDEDELIALFDLVGEWSSGDSKSKENPRPDFTQGGRENLINGGVCKSFDCDDGGINVKYTKNGILVTVSTVEGGPYQCGNCRYFRTGPRFLDEQIYYYNKIGIEIKDLTDKRMGYLKKANEAYDNPEVNSSHIVAERYTRKADHLSKILAFRITESRRRELLIDKSKEAIREKNKDTELVNIQDDDMLEANFFTEELNMMDACMETSIQAAMLGLDEGEDACLNKLDMFLIKIANISKEDNPFLMIPDESTKRLAVLYKLYDSMEMMGLTVSDEEFNSPSMLMDRLGKKEFSNLTNNLLSAELSLMEIS
jgi:hypothetical protein